MLRLRNILVGKDLSEPSEQALRFACAFAGRVGAELHIVHVQVLHPDAFAPTTYPTEHAERVQAAMDETLNRIAPCTDPDEGAAPAVRTDVVSSLAVAPALVSYAREHDVDLLVCGTHGRRGIRHMMLGSVAEELVRTAECPVLTVRSRAGAETALPGPDGDVLVPVDFSDHSLHAIQVGREVASLFGSGVRLVHVVEETLHPAFYNAGAFSIYDLQPDIEARALEHLRRMYEAAPGPKVPVTFHVGTGHPADEIAARAGSGGVGAIVMATHGLTGLAHLLLGSVAEHVVRMSPVPVLTVKSFGRDLPEERRERGAGNTD